MIRAGIKGTGLYIPPFVVTNEDLSKMVDTSDEWITSRTGIKERRILIEGDASDMGTEAALNVLRNSNVKAEEIDMIIVSTLTPDMFTPSCACIVQKNIGAVNASAFDINAACSGFLYALNIAESFIKSKKAKNILIVAVEVLSKIVNWEDRNTCVLFGDGAGAVMVSEESNKGIMSIYTKSYGDKGDSLTCKALGLNNPFVRHKQENIKSFVSMDGKEVFRFATSAMVEAIEKVVQDAELNISDISKVIPHQANYRIIEYASKKLGLDMDKFYINLYKYGNTSCASIPIALHEAVSEGAIKEGDNVVLVGFGGGLTCGATIIRW